jgi:hypothetical protein
MPKKTTTDFRELESLAQLHLPLNEPLRLDRLRFDLQNPRIFERLGPKATQDEIQSLLVTGDMKALELVPSFIENGYIPYEPLIVRRVRDYFVVLEGNRRLAALRSMQRSQDAEEIAAFKKYKLNEVPCTVFEGGDRQLLAYLGLRHLSKTKDWSPSAKGSFVERVLKAGMDLREAGRLTNTSVNGLRQILLTRRLFETAGSLGLDLPRSGAEGETTFWHLGDAIRRTRTKEYLGLQENPNPLKAPTFDETKFEHLIGWLYGNTKTRQQRVIESIRDIGYLDSCLGNKRATERLEEGSSLAEAREELEAAGAAVSGHIGKAKRSIQRAMSGISDVDKDGLQQVKDATKELDEATVQFANALKTREEILQKASKI